MILSELLRDIDNLCSDNELYSVEIKNVRIDSRKIEEGDLFICIPGLTVDGHNFALAAQENGAAAIICEYEIEGINNPIIVRNAREALSRVAANLYDNPSKKLKMIGVTGTNGKTSVTHLVKSVLDYAGIKSGLIGTAHNMIGDEVIPANMTTPDPLEFHKLLRRMVDQGCMFAVMEISSHALALNKLAGCRFEVGAFTNLTQDHLDFHKNMNEYLKSKAKLFSMSKKAVINADDEYGARLAKDINNGCMTFGLNDGCDLKADKVQLDATGVTFNCRRKKIKLDIPGSFTVYNALAAIGICVQAGLSMDRIMKGLAKSPGVKGRVEVVPTDTDYTVLIDYAHTPDALKNVLKTIKGYCIGKIILVFGCGGDRDKGKRPKMGRVAVEYADFSIVTSDNPRSEDPKGIIKEIIEGMRIRENRFVAIENRYDAIKYALRMARANDVVVLAGKGHETYQIFKDKTIDFDERQVVKEILGA